ncbi:ABC transporter substrate-binding protein [Aquabacterium sp.]|uniref:ABC transporter substrate-binding protein n=1 Tax=Aquabacterium sp. TaxID=1872578 RepID=UPI002CDB682B|nr:ABC transporter substrate-binding protein [Aquabacterium sp.]HSW03431.1 ABC transporter substrate-binding protein [Aquabacterium sp.]
MLRRRELLAGASALPTLGAAAAGANAGTKTLRLALPAAETPFDPPQAESSTYTYLVIASIFESPLGYDYLARPPRLVPVTAAALPEISADFRQVTLRIRPGIFFADDPAFKGKPRELVAQDYVYSIKRFYDPRWKSADLYLFEGSKLLGLSELRQRAISSGKPFDYDTEVEGLRALDRYTLRLRMADPDPRFIYQLALPYLSGAVAREVVEHYGNEISAHPVGTGAYRLVSWRRGSRIVLERSPGFRGEVYQGQPADTPEARAIADKLSGQRLPLIDRIEFSIIEEQQPYWLSFVNGQLDWAEVPGSFGKLAVPNGRLAPFLQKKGVQLALTPQADMLMSYFNHQDPVVGGLAPDKVALRRAIALAHDGGSYRRLVRGGLAVPAQSAVPPYTIGYEADYRSEMSEHDPAKSRALLDLFGYVDRDGDGWREMPDGRPLTLRIASLADQAARDGNEVWQRSLTAVGLRVVFEPARWSELLLRSRSGSLMIWGYGWTAASPDGAFFLGLAYGPNASESNDARFALPAFDRLYERQRVLPDGPERAALMREGKNLMVAYMPYKVHGHRIQADLLQPWLHNYWRHPFMRDIWRYLDIAPH